MRCSKLTLLTMLLSAACTHDDPTRVLVTIDADRTVNQRATKLQLVVTRDPGGAAERVYDERRDAKFPLVLELSPEQASSRLGYRLEVVALQGTRTLTTARLESGYVEGDERYVALQLEDACIDVVCADDQSCHAGACTSSSVPATALGVDGDAPPHSYDLVGTKPAGPRDAAVDTPKGDDPDASGLDAGDGPFTGNVGSDASGPSTPRDAAADPSVDVDASVAPDAARPRDAQVAPVDASPAMPCTPSGEFMVTAVETSGTCKLPPGSFDVALAGKLEQFLPTDTPCSRVVKVAPDGCSLDFNFDCPVIGAEHAYREQGEAHVVTPEHIVVTSSTLVLHPESNDCTSLRTYDLRSKKP